MHRRCSPSLNMLVRTIPWWLSLIVIPSRRSFRGEESSAATVGTTFHCSPRSARDDIGRKHQTDPPPIRSVATRSRLSALVKESRSARAKDPPRIPECPGACPVLRHPRCTPGQPQQRCCGGDEQPRKHVAEARVDRLDVESRDFALDARGVEEWASAASPSQCPRSR